MTTKNCVNGPKLVLKDLCEKSFVRNVLYSRVDIVRKKNECLSLLGVNSLTTVPWITLKFETLETCLFQAWQ